MAVELDLNSSIEEENKSKKKKKHKNLEFEDGKIDNNDGKSSEKKISKKKRKASHEEKSDTIFDVTVRANGCALKNLKLRMMRIMRISKVLREKLKSKGIESMFPIQTMTFDSIFDGSNLVCQERTGQGKTLAFVLPILEFLTNGQYKEAKKTGCGRPPSVLVLLPTRELTNQVYADFQAYSGAVGWIKDHIERGTLDLKFLKFRILDQADEMLNMGFVDDVELILSMVEDVIVGEHRRDGIEHENYAPDKIDLRDGGGYGVDGVGGDREAVVEDGGDDEGDRAINEDANALHDKDSGDEGPAGLLVGILEEFMRKKRR
uniref:RNA helicase n=1 Tax=Elaeis guineensis var. tenera TaxID=51953 RepID=A0A6I9SET2_ELAGV|nr:DEAD-box ATP-dependent RNA helicase 7-like [Elaeis guineensis]